MYSDRLREFVKSLDQILLLELLVEHTKYIDELREYQKRNDMDKEIRSIEKKTKGVEKSLKHLESQDKKRDKICDYGKKEMAKKKKHKK